MMQKRDVLNSPRLSELKKQRRRAFLNKILISLLEIGVVVAFLSFISRVDKLNISAVEISGNKIIDTEIIKEAVEEEITGYYVWLFPKKNIFFYPKNQIEKILNQKFTRLKTITSSIKDRKILEISVTERVPKYTWCGTILPEPDANNGTCYFLDETGYIFDEAPYFSGEVYFKFYGLTDLEDNIPSGFYFSEFIFPKLILFKETLEHMGLKPVALYIMDDGNIKVYLSNESLLERGPEIILKADSDFQKKAENLEVALTTEPLQSNFKNKYSSLLYIDLRFGNKVYYKFR